MRKLSLFIAVLILTLLALPAYAASTTQVASDYLVKIGEKDLKSGDLQGAIHEFSKALMLNPDNKKAQYLLSRYNINRNIYPNLYSNRQEENYVYLCGQ